MYVATFYSYKGGVGRTMALVNVAVLLAKLGRRVLVVDFDLEAPGLPSYQAFRGAESRHGIVDYVTAYRTTGAAPNASEYITQCDVDGIPLWLMPAGDYTRRGYSEALQSIDWQDLYDHQSGFLMFEDLKQQWAQYDGKGFDYVLIDSRTGHTDVGGICTRQLPDAVVVMFVPNEQNIDGLAPIVDGIRQQNKLNKGDLHKKDITLHFCPSNVPDLDDEKHILSDLLEAAKKKLDYDHEPASIVHNYGSLEILSQPTFALSRPNSRLTKEYDALRTSIIAANFSDREGAIVALKRMPDLLEWARKNQVSKLRAKIYADAVEIRRNHPKDGEIAYLAARVFSDIGEQDEELDALTMAVDVGSDANRARLARAGLHLMAARKDEARTDLLEVLSSQTATVFELAPALQMSLRIKGLWLDAVGRALERPDSEFKTLLTLSTFIMTRRDALPALALRMMQSFSSSILSDDQRRRARNLAVLSLIGSGEFARAKTLLDSNDIAAVPIEDHFNAAMAEWGVTKSVPVDALEALARRFAKETPSSSANYHQCFALVLTALGHREAAEKELAAAKAKISAGGVEFSCWRYLNVGADDLVEDIKAMHSASDRGDKVAPPFLVSVPVPVH